MAAVVDEATGVIRTTSVLQEPEQQGRPSTGPVRLLWTHYKSAKGTLERLAADASEGRLDVHSPYVERAVCLLEVLVLRKEKGPHHFMNLTLGAPVIPNNPEFDPSGDGKRRSELPPTDDVPELLRRMLTELEHAMRPTIRPGGRALDVSKAAKALQEAIQAARSKEPKQRGMAAAAAPIPVTEEEKGSACCSSASACSKDAVPSGAGALGSRGLRQRGHQHHSSKGPKHAHASSGGSCCASEERGKSKSKGLDLAAAVAAVVAWARAALSGPEGVGEHMHMAGGGCCGGGAVGPSRMGAKQDGHGFMVAVLALVLLLPFVLWWMS